LYIVEKDKFKMGYLSFNQLGVSLNAVIFFR
jgi:hypothetical protein